MIRGHWSLRTDGSGFLNFARIVNANNYAPNLFAAGTTPGQQGSGAQLLGNFGSANVDDGVSWAIEHEPTPTKTSATGTLISSFDTGKFSDRNGIFVQFTGRLGNSPNPTFPPGIADRFDMDQCPNVTGRVNYTLTYRVPASGREWRQEITLQVAQNQFGPVATAVLSHNISGYPEQKISYAAQPALAGFPLDQGWYTSVPAYYSVAGLNPSFVDYPWVPNSARSSPVTWSETAPGTGRLVAVGGPAVNPLAPFFEVSTSGALLPGFAATYVLQAIDNRLADTTVARVNALDVQLFDVNRQGTSRTFSQGQSLVMITDYAVR